MPAVREPGDNPAGLEVVEIRPGVRLKLNSADRAAYLKHEADAAERQRAWNLINAGTEDQPAKEKKVAGPSQDGPVDDAAPVADAAPDAEEATVTAAPKPRTRSRKK